MHKHPVRLALLPLLGGLTLSCSESDSAVQTVEQRFQSASADAVAVMGFESPSLWSSSRGTLGQTPIHTQGAFAMSVQSSGWTELLSTPTGPVGSVGGEASLQIFLTNNESWGTVGLTLHPDIAGGLWTKLPCTGATKCSGADWDLSQLEPGQWHILKFDLSAASPSFANNDDVRFRITLNGSGSTRYLDDLRVDVAAPSTGSGGSGSGGTSGGTGGGATGGTGSHSDNARVLGFEDVSFGTQGAFEQTRPSSAENLHSSVIAKMEAPGDFVEGQASLGVNLVAEDPSERIVYQMVTPKMSDVGPVGDVMNFDLRLPEDQRFERHLGYLQVFVTTDDGMIDQWIGQKGLSGELFGHGSFRSVQIAVPQFVQDHLSERSYSEAHFRFVFSQVVPGLYVLDNLNFRDTLPSSIPPVPSVFTDAVFGFESLSAWQTKGDGMVMQGDGSADSVPGTPGMSLCMNDFTNFEARSANLSTLGKIDSEGKVQLGLSIPDLSDVGQLNINGFVWIPSQNVWGRFIGHHSVNAGTGDSFRFFEFDVSAVQNIIENETYGDLSFEFKITLPQPTEDPVCMDGLDPGHLRWSYDHSPRVTRLFDIEIPQEADISDVAVYVGRTDENRAGTFGDDFKFRESQTNGVLVSGSKSTRFWVEHQQSFQTSA